MVQIMAVGTAVLMMAAVQTPSRPPGAAADRPADTAVVLTGCVVASTEGKETRLMLINASAAPAGGQATPPPEAGSTGVGTTGTGTSGIGATPSSTIAPNMAPMNVLLTSARNVSLQRHVNRRVEVQGRMIGGLEAPVADLPRQVHVTKVRRLSGDCSKK